jgi:hypothetical protein
VSGDDHFAGLAHCTGACGREHALDLTFGCGAQSSFIGIPMNTSSSLCNSTLYTEVRLRFVPKCYPPRFCVEGSGRIAAPLEHGSTCLADQVFLTRLQRCHSFVLSRSLHSPRYSEANIPSPRNSCQHPSVMPYSTSPFSPRSPSYQPEVLGNILLTNHGVSCCYSLQ